jgi:glycosyl hydrolase family 10
MNERKGTSINFFRIISGVLLLLFGVIGSMYAGPNPSEGIKAVFENKDTKWICERMSFAEPRYINYEMGKGYEFNCDFSLADSGYTRCYWDAKLKTPVDLSKAASIVMNVEFSNLESVKFLSFFLKSNGTWFLSKYYGSFGKGNNFVVFQIPDYRKEGTSKPSKPELLNHVEEIRVNVFPKNGQKTKPTLVKIIGVRVSDTKIDGYASIPLFETPEADKGLKRKYRRNKAGKLLESRIMFSHIFNVAYFKEGADKTLDRIKSAGFNVYMPELWHGNGAFFRSKTTKIPPKYAKYFKDNADPTAEMINKAHARGIEVHPSFDVAYRGWPDAHPEFTKDGMPTSGGYLTPYDVQDPKFRDFIVKEIVAFVTKYDVDGISLDYVRAIGGLGFSKIASEIYRKKYNADLNELKGKLTPELKARMLEWQEQAISDIVKRVSKGIRAAKPNVVISVCGHPLPKPRLQKEGRNEWLWLEKGWIDIALNMDYSWTPDFKAFEKAANSIDLSKHFMLMVGDSDKDGGKSFPRKAEQLVRLVDYALKKYPGYGVGIYDYGSLSDEQIKALRAGPFKEDSLPYWPKHGKRAK